MILNIGYDLPDDMWAKVPLIYQRPDGWKSYGDGQGNGEKNIPYWFSFNENEKHICVSSEPSGLLFTGNMESKEWEAWKLHVKRIATEILGFKVGEIELGKVGREIEYLD